MAPLDSLRLIDGVSLLGGYDATFTSRDFDVHPTRILGSDSTEGDSLTPTRAVTVPGSVGTTTVFEGFIVQGGGGDGGVHAALVIEAGAMPKVRRNVLRGGDSNLASLSGSVGLMVGRGAAPSLRANRIEAGVGAFSYGVWLVEASPVFLNNLVLAGSGTSSIGMWSSAGSPQVLNNTVSGGSGTTEATGLRVTGGQPTFENNLVFTSGPGRRSCLSDETTPSRIVSLRNNDLFDCPTALVARAAPLPGATACAFDPTLVCVTDVATLNARPDGGAVTISGNLSVDPGFADAATGDYHLTPSSPGEVKTGGLDLTPTVFTDFEQRNRTAPFSIGAYEEDR